MRPVESPERGLGNGAELFCQEFIPMVTPFCLQILYDHKNIAMVSGLSGVLGMVFNRGGEGKISDIGCPLSVHQCVGVSLWDCFKQKRL